MTDSKSLHKLWVSLTVCVKILYIFLEIIYIFNI